MSGQWESSLGIMGYGGYGEFGREKVVDEKLSRTSDTFSNGVPGRR